VKATFTPAVNPTPQIAYLKQTVNAPTGDFTLTGPSTLTTPTEGTVTGTLTLTSIADFSGTVGLICNLPLPTTYTCTISPTSVPLTVGGTGSATVSLMPTLNHTANESSSRIVLALLLPLTLLSLTGFARHHRGRFAALLLLALLAIFAGSITACGKDIAYPITQPGSYPLTVTATGTTKGATAPETHTLNITLILTP